MVSIWIIVIIDIDSSFFLWGIVHFVLLNLLILASIIHFGELPINNLWFIDQFLFNVIFLFFVEFEQTLLELGLIGFYHFFIWWKIEVETILIFLIFIVRILLYQGDNVDEVRMIGVDVSQLYLNQVSDHLFSVWQGFVQELFHDFINSYI